MGKFLSKSPSLPYYLPNSGKKWWVQKENTHVPPFFSSPFHSPPNNPFTQNLSHFPFFIFHPPQITLTKHTRNVNEAQKFENYPSISTIIGKGKIRKICFFNNKSMEEIARLERKIVVMCKEGSFYKGSHTSNPNLYND